MSTPPPAEFTVPAHAGCAACATGGPVKVEDIGPDWVTETIRTDCTVHQPFRITVTGTEGAPLAVTVLMEDRSVRSSPVWEWIEAVSPDSSPRAFVAGLDVLRRTREMVRDGLPAQESTLLWALAGAQDVDTVRSAERAGLSGHDAARFTLTIRSLHVETLVEPLLAVACLRWLLALTTSGEEDPETALRIWLRLGISDPDDRPAGLLAEDVKVLSLAGVQDRSPLWAGAGRLCPAQVTSGILAGAEPEDIVALFTALDPDDGVWNCWHDGGWACQWDKEAVVETVERAREVDETQWGDLAVCLRAGMPWAEAKKHVQAGADMAPVRLLAALTV